MLGVLLGEGEVLVLLVITVIVVFIVARGRRRK